MHRPRHGYDIPLVAEGGKPLRLQRLAERVLGVGVGREQVVPHDRRSDLVDHLQRPAGPIIEPVNLELQPVAVPDDRPGQVGVDQVRFVVIYGGAVYRRAGAPSMPAGAAQRTRSSDIRAK